MSIGCLVHDGPTLEPSLTYLAYLNKHFQWNIKEIKKLRNYLNIAVRLEDIRLELLHICQQNEQVLNDLDFNDERTLIHGDLNSSNILVDPTNGNVTAILDWEFASFGFDDANVDYFLRNA
jgi:Ser/Thr protein kinase RdoA (MazF antagonist)